MRLSLLIFLITLGIVSGASRDRFKQGFTIQKPGGFIGVDSLRPTTDTTDIKVTNRAGNADVMIIDIDGLKIGIKKTPTEDLDVLGTVKAASFVGDGSQLSGLSVTGAALPNFTIATAHHQALAKEYILVDSNAGSFNVTPPTAVPGVWFVVADIGQASVNPVRVLTDGVKIMSLTNDLLIDADRVWVKFVYADASRGWVFEGP